VGGTSLHQGKMEMRTGEGKRQASLLYQCAGRQGCAPSITTNDYLVRRDGWNGPIYHLLRRRNRSRLFRRRSDWFDPKGNLEDDRWRSVSRPCGVPVYHHVWHQ